MTRIRIPETNNHWLTLPSATAAVAVKHDLQVT